MNKRAWVSVVVGLASGLGVEAGWAGAAVETIALKGEAAPGVPSSWESLFWSYPTLSDAGLAFDGGLTPWPTESLWVALRGSGPMLAAKRGTAAPGSAGGEFDSFEAPHINNDGAIAFRGSMSIFSPNVDGSNNEGIWRGLPGGLALIARKGSQAPGLGEGARFASFDEPFMTNGGGAAFVATVQGGEVVSGTGQGIWSEAGGQGLRKVIRQGDAAGGIAGAKVKSFDDPVAGGRGVALLATVEGMGITTDNDNAIYRGSADRLTLVAREEEVAPGAGGKRFWWMDAPNINDLGQVAFHSRLTDFGEGIWSEGHGGLRAVALKDSAAPGGGKFSEFESPLINNRGDVVFHGRLSIFDGVGTNNEGIWKQKGGVLEQVVRKGQQPPGLPAGNAFVFFEQIDMNELGQVAFVGKTDAIMAGIWAERPDGELVLVAYKGQELEVAPGDFRTIESLRFAEDWFTPDARASSFNNHGQLAFYAEFEDDTHGIFLAQVPEPTALMGVGLGSLMLLRRRQR